MTINPSGGQPGINVRARPAPGSAQANNRAIQPGQTSDWMRTGDRIMEGQQRAEQEGRARAEINAQNRKSPLRFRLRQGEEADVIVLDAAMGPAIWEHDLTYKPPFQRQNQYGKPVDQYVSSPKEWETDPISAKFGLEPYYCLYLSVVDMRQGVTSQNKPFKNVRKLLCLKGDALTGMMNIWAQMRTHNPNATLRGLHLLMKRGHEQTSLKSGLPNFVAQYGEADIVATFAHPAIMSEREVGKIIKPENADCYPFDYADIFPKPSAEAIKQRYPQFLADVNVPGQTGGFNTMFGQSPGIPQGGNFGPQGTQFQPGMGGQPAQTQTPQAPAPQTLNPQPAPGIPASTGIQGAASGGIRPSATPMPGENGGGGVDFGALDDDDEIPF